jgi:hypothetical protein
VIPFLANYKLAMIGILVGGIGGYAYYHFVGCVSGSCPITSQPINSTAYGAVMGAFLFSGFKREKNNRDEKQNHSH